MPWSVWPKNSIHLPSVVITSGDLQTPAPPLLHSMRVPVEEHLMYTVWWYIFLFVHIYNDTFYWWLTVYDGWNNVFFCPKTCVICYVTVTSIHQCIVNKQLYLLKCFYKYTENIWRYDAMISTEIFTRLRDDSFVGAGLVRVASWWYAYETTSHTIYVRRALVFHFTRASSRCLT